ncbi:PucR family transcriptional regulator ligand-binding domain-containing protein [Paenibacillus sp. MMS20-IR301]|uniref:PucR family transcriptional regulator n=1 Tax=Paenibacillus sp. MMS20-IR301 TaxID=2895946 RepID=UPI0028E73167|nr:PucR family transcriptional regulator ligand-binding domain-containing protein [Paenibacillus sp. MMS20-IR301]WNS44398.1 PucR family transcriptional regulator ligand-binding domain-containing protein [Paenibacillus sp. MMS20-IR301]
MNTRGITLRELMELPELKKAKVISGEQGLERIVRFVDIMEVPDLKGWVSEGVMLLTTAYSIRHDPSLLTDLIYTLNNVGAAALAIKPARFLKEIPQGAIEASNACGLPIVEIPPEIPYTDITQPVMELLLGRQAMLLRRAEEVYRTLTTMVLENSGIQAVTDNVAEFLKAPVALVDTEQQIIVSSPSDFDWEHRPAPLSWNIHVDRRTVARLQVDKERLDDMEEVGIEQARLVFALELMRRKVAEDTEFRLRGNFIDELLTPPLPSRHEVQRRARQLKMNPEHKWEVAVIEGETAPDEETVNRLLDREARRRGVIPHVEYRSSRAVLFLPTPEGRKSASTDDDEDSWARTLEGWLQDKSTGLGSYRSGIGTPEYLWDIYTSYNEARKALSVSRRLGQGGGSVTRYEQMEVYHLLEGLDSQRFERLFERKLGKLLRYDKEHDSNMLLTFYHYLECRGSLIETANSLYIHRNSVKYRLERIRDITGFDLNDPREQFVCHLCLIYYYLQEK